MAARVFSISNMKGGVGKTTIAVALAYEFARGYRDQGARVLLVDLDAQANASFWICGDELLTRQIEQGKTIEAFLEDSIVFGRPAELSDYVHHLDGAGAPGRLSVIPSSPELRIIEREIIVFLSRRRRNLLEVERVVTDLFEAQLAKLRDQYDVIIFDSAPGISAMTEAALRASEVIIVPTVPDFISNLGLEAFCKSVAWSGKNEAERRRPWVVANMVKDTPHHQLMLREMRAEAAAPDGGFRMFQLEIPDAAWIEEAASASAEGKRLVLQQSPVFAELAKEVLNAS